MVVIALGNSSLLERMTRDVRCARISAVTELLLSDIPPQR
jgi:hypothetical protein